MVQINLDIFVSICASGPAHVPTSRCLGRSAGNSCSKSVLLRKKKQPWKVCLGHRGYVKGSLDFLPGSLILPLFFLLCSVENPSKSSRTSEPQPKRQKKMKVPQDVDMEDLGDES